MSDGPPYEVVSGSAEAGILFICDHASNRIPRRMAGLGIDPAALSQHVAWDIGAAALTRALAARLAAPAVLANTSRLVIDCNRAPGHATSIPANSHGVAVPGNAHLGPAERRQREAEWFSPYHDRIEQELAALERAGGRPLLVSIHSFTPILTGPPRPWHVGVLSDRDRATADVFLTLLRALPGLVVGDNEPYSGQHPEGYSCQTHGDALGRRNVLFEVRQDLLASESAIEAWADRLAPVLRDGLQHFAAAGAPAYNAATRPRTGETGAPIMDDRTRTELEAAAFRRLLKHFDDHKEVQNIDLMNLAHFCRNCLAKWYRAAAEERGITNISYDDAREIVYGMPYEQWKAKYQNESSTEQKAAFEKGAAQRSKSGASH